MKILFKWGGIIVVVIIVISIITSLGKSGNNSSSNINDVVNTTKAYSQVFTFSGDGSKNSETFAISGDRAKFKYQCTGIPCYAKLRPVKKRPGFLWKDIFNTDRSTEDETIIYESGEFYIEVVSSDTFSIAVEDYK